MDFFHACRALSVRTYKAHSCMILGHLKRPMQNNHGLWMSSLSMLPNVLFKISFIVSAISSV